MGVVPLDWCSACMVPLYKEKGDKWQIKAKKCLYEGVIVPTALYGAEEWGIRSDKKRNLNVLEMKCLRSLVGVSRIYKVKNEEVSRTAGIENGLASRADQKVLR